MTTPISSQAIDRYCDIDQKRMTTRYLHLGPQLVEPVELTLSNGSR